MHLRPVRGWTVAVAWATCVPFVLSQTSSTFSSAPEATPYDHPHVVWMDCPNDVGGCIGSTFSISWNRSYSDHWSL